LDEDFVFVLPDLVPDEAGVAGVLALARGYVEVPCVVRAHHVAAFKMACRKGSVLMRTVILEGEEAVRISRDPRDTDLLAVVSAECPERSWDWQLVGVAELYNHGVAVSPCEILDIASFSSLGSGASQR
jgi:hypothetical protein